MSVSAVDLFCGIGGLTRGLESAGISVEAGIDVDPDCRYPYEANNDAEFICQDVSDTSSDLIQEMFSADSHRLLAGCAPCQPFSNYNNGIEREAMDEWGLLNQFARFVEDLEPELIAMENVIELRNHDVYSRFVDTLFKAGYSISVHVVDCTKYGVPQSRSRLVVLASKLGDIALAEPTHETLDRRPTVRQAIGEECLPPIEAGGQDPDDRLHASQGLTEINLKRIRQSSPGGTWHDWDEALILNCHKRESGSSYKSVYGRMEWDEPAPTITTQFYGYGNGRFGHPEQDRAISLREGAMLQTFPRDYEFVNGDSDVHFDKIGRFIGNAVPVRLAEVVGESITDHVEGIDV